MTNEQRLENYIRRGCAVASVEEAVWLIENAYGLCFEEHEVDAAYKYIRDQKAQAVVPAWIARGAEDMDRVGDFN